MAKAQANAAKRGTHVMVIFHASWCGWCKKLDAFMARPAYKQLFADNYEIVHLDVLENGDKKALENPGGGDVMKKYGGEGAGLPWIFIADKNGKKVIDSFRDGNPKQNIGCPWEPEEVKWFLTMFDKTKKQVSAEQRKALEADLLKQKTEKAGGGS
jgi:thiol-disulfide isomerase/thioredoxin